LNVYAKRHRVLFKNRPAAEIIERTNNMLKFNQFKEKREVEYWDNEKSKKDTKMGRGGVIDDQMDRAKRRR